MTTLCSCFSWSLKLYLKIQSNMFIPLYSSRLMFGHWSSNQLSLINSESPFIYNERILSRLSGIVILLKSIEQDRKLIEVLFVRSNEHNSVRSSLSVVPCKVTVSNVVWCPVISSFFQTGDPFLFQKSLLPILIIKFEKKQYYLSSGFRRGEIYQKIKCIKD